MYTPISNRRARERRTAVAVALALPLLSAGTCLNLARESVIDGFFDVVTPALNAELQDHLGLNAASARAAGRAVLLEPAP